MADAALLEEAGAGIGALERYLAPIHPERLMARIVGLLSNFYVEEVEEGAQAMALDLWRRAAARFPEWAIEKAIDQLAIRRQRPLIADLVELCREMVDPHAIELDCLRDVVDRAAQEWQYLAVVDARAQRARQEAEAAHGREEQRRAYEALIAANPDGSVSAPAGRGEPPSAPGSDALKRSMKAALDALKGWRLAELPSDERRARADE